LRARHRRAPADSLAAAAGGADRRPLHAGAAVARSRSRLRRAVVPTARDDRARLRRPRDRAARHAAAGQLSGGPDTAPTPPTLGAGPGNPGRPSMMRRVPRLSGSPDTAPTPPTLGAGPGNPGRPSMMRRVPRLSRGPDTAPTPPTAHLRLASAVERPAASHSHAGPGNPGRPSMMRALSAW